MPAATKKVSKTGIRMTKKNRVAILSRAREIISDKKNWTRRKLRRREGDRYRYCLLGACEQAAYDLGLAEPGKMSFAERLADSQDPFGYLLGVDISIQDFSLITTGKPAQAVNDQDGYEAAVKLVDDYIAELKKPTPKQ